MKNIVLASKSPRRKELLEKCNVAFTLDPADIDETLDITQGLQKAIEKLSYEKAKTVLDRHTDTIVIGSDTIVTIHDKVLGKPKDEKDAFDMLKQLQGNTHEVITAVTFLSTKRIYQNVSVSKVTFAPMSDEEIYTYIATGECLDKAGAYGIQGYGGRYITHIDGDYYTIMGFPLHIVYEELKHIGLY